MLELLELQFHSMSMKNRRQIENIHSRSANFWHNGKYYDIVTIVRVSDHNYEYVIDIKIDGQQGDFKDIQWIS